MKETIVRLTGITIENFKNVKYGHIDFQGSSNYEANILGLYGQNGSGKTALIDALAILKTVLCGHPIPKKYSDYINVDSDFASLSYELELHCEEEVQTIFYDFELHRKQDVMEHNHEEEVSQPHSTKVEIEREKLSYKLEKEGKVVERKNVLIDTDTEDVFLPKGKYKELFQTTGKGLEELIELLMVKKLSKANGKSFIFSAEFVKRIRKLGQSLEGDLSDREKLIAEYMYVLNRLVEYGHKELFVINTSDMGLISLGTLPFTIGYEGSHKGAAGKVHISLSHVNKLPEKELAWIDVIICNMNTVLEKLVPGLILSMKRLGKEINEEGELVELVQFLSHKNGKEIPFNNESDGIKKIVSILNLLIAVFHCKSVTVVVDELDSGVFEYLLGELLQIIEQRGLGQLIFTSHNLRALETLDKNSICFTTTNPSNRYIRFSNVKATNNLRDLYFRDILLNEHSEKVCDLTNNSEIIMAFRRAGAEANG